jgi:hypothetical protein
MGLFDADVLEEAAVVAWFSRASEAGSAAAEVRARAKKFVEWLQEAEEEGDDEEDDGEED